MFVLHCLSGRPWEDSQIKQLTEYQDISQPERPPTNKIVFSCSFNKEYNKYACTETKPHLQESPCNADDPNCLRHGIHDAKPQKNDSKAKGCNNPKIAICKGPLFPGKRNNIKDSEKRPDQQRSSCNHGDVLCLVVNRKSLRTFSRLKRKLKASQKGFGAMHVGVAKDCTSSGDPSCTRSIEPASIKVSGIIMNTTVIIFENYEYAC